MNAQGAPHPPRCEGGDGRAFLLSPVLPARPPRVIYTHDIAYMTLEEAEEMRLRGLL